MLTEQRFAAQISQTGARSVIAIPFDPNEVWGAKQRHHITGRVGSYPIRGPLEHDGARYVLTLGAAWRRDNPIEDGATVEVALIPEGPQGERLSPDLAAALNAEPAAESFFESLPTFYRKNYVRWIESAKRPETRANRIAETVRLLNAGQREK